MQHFVLFLLVKYIVICGVHGGSEQLTISNKLPHGSLTRKMSNQVYTHTNYEATEVIQIMI